MSVVAAPRRQFYTDAQNDVLRAALERLIDTYGSQTKAGKLVDIKQGTVSAFLSKKHGATPGVARKIAQLSGTTVEELLGWTSGGLVVTDPYANRAVATHMARLAGLGEAAIATVEALRLGEDVIDQPILWWFDRIRLEAGGGST